MALQRKPRRPDRPGFSSPPAGDGEWGEDFSTDGEPSSANREALSAAEVRTKAITLLARREHSRMELRRKLSRSGGDEDAVETVLDALEAEKLLSDQRFAEGLARVRGARFGSRRVADDLRRTGVGVEAVALVESLKASDDARAREVWERKFGTAPADASARAKQMRFLLSRGFPTDVIYRVVPRPTRGGADT